MSHDNQLTKGMATDAQVKKIEALTGSPDFKLPLASFLKSATAGRASCIEELTSAQADDVLGVIKKLTKGK